MSKLAAIQALAAQAAATGVDMTKATKGGSGGRLLPAGYAFGRLVEYIELGKQPQEFQGKAKDPVMEVQLGFALYGQGYQNDDGTPYIVRPYSIALGTNEKSRAFKLFNLLNWKNTYTHFSQLLAVESWLVKIVHEPKSKTDPTIVSRIDLDGFLPPLDPVTKAPYPIPEVDEDILQLFLWDYPTKEGWDALFVDGKWDDGKSKNRTQETILAAVDFAGSPLHTLLMGAGLSALPAAAVAPPAAPVAQAVPTQPAAPVIAPAAPAVAPVGIQPAPVVAPAAPLVPSVPVAAVQPTPVAPLPVAPIVAPVVPTLPSNPV